MSTDPFTLTQLPPQQRTLQLSYTDDGFGQVLARAVEQPTGSWLVTLRIKPYVTFTVPYGQLTTAEIEKLLRLLVHGATAMHNDTGERVS